MKKLSKILSLLLVAVIVIGILPLSVFSAPITTPILGFSDGADILDPKEINDFGNIIIGKHNTTLYVPIKLDEWYSATGNDIEGKDFNNDAQNRVEIVFENTEDEATFKHLFTWPVTFEHQSAVEIPRLVLTGYNIGSIDLNFQIKYRLGNNDDDQQWIPPSYALSKSYHISGEFIDPTINNKITEISGENIATDAAGIFYNDDLIFSNAQIESGAHDDEIRAYFLDLNVQPGDEYKFILHTDHFTWERRIDKMRASVRKSTLDNSQITALETISEGHGLFEVIQIENVEGNFAGVMIRFVDSFNATKERDIDFNVALALKGYRNVASGVDFAGTFGNPVHEIHEDNDYVFIGDGTVAEAKASVRDIQLDLDNGVVAHVNVIEGKRYYGRSYIQPTNDDKEIMNYFPSIRFALTLKTTNVDRAKYVTITQDAKYFVYDANGEYLGTTSDKLQFRTKYYLSTAMLEFTDEAPFDESEPGDNPPTGGGFGFTTTMNIVGIVALAIGGLTLKKRKNQNGKEQ